MKILIGYDGSECSEAALDDLKAAGLPAAVDAYIVSVAEVWLPPPAAGVSVSEYAHNLKTRSQPFKTWQTGGEEIENAVAIAKAAANRLHSIFPEWKVNFEGTYGSPAWELITKASDLKADLIVVGSQGRSAFGRFFLGSISQKVLTEAECSVRIARGKIEVDPAPARIVIAFDGSAGANAAVDAVVLRHWPSGSEARIICVTDLPFVPDMSPASQNIDLGSDSEWVYDLAAGAVSKLKGAGLPAEVKTEFGNPKDVIVDFAEEWRADAIFMGANRFGGRVERFLLESVSAAVAARAHCSVEVVRRRVSS